MNQGMHIIIAPNAFKNSLSAEEAANAIAEGLNRSKLTCTCEGFPIADGGDGTCDLIIKRCSGSLVRAAVHDPLGKEINASYGLIDDGHTAVIEMANASGIKLLKPDDLDPMRASTSGTGELIRSALDQGVSKIIMGVGGSATVDGACGILSALGIRFLDAQGQGLTDIPGSLVDLSEIDFSDLDQRILDCALIVLCDVDNRLLGEQGAAAVFGPQKGASPDVVRHLDVALAKLSAVALQHTGKDMASVKYGGAAGGVSAGLFAFLDARMVNGIDYFLQLTDFNTALEKADLVITGEGSIDAQTLQGKGPFGVAYCARQKGIPVIALAGKIPLEPHSGLQAYFDVLVPIGHQPLDLTTALVHTEDNLIRTAGAIGDLLALAG